MKNLRSAFIIFILSIFNSGMSYGQKSTFKLISTQTQFHTNSNWEDHSIAAFTYNANGDMEEMILSRYDNNQSLNPHYRSESVFASNGTIAEIKTYTWDGNIWEQSSSIDRTYNQNKLSESINRKLTNGQLSNSNKSSYIYNSEGRMIQMINQIFDQNAWSDFSRSTYSYAGKKVVAILNEKLMNGTWTASTNSEYIYTGNNVNRVIIKVKQNQVFENSTRISYTYDSNGNQLTSITEIWKNATWELNSRTHNTWQQLTDVATNPSLSTLEMNVFPNPSSGIFNLELKSEIGNKIEVNVFDLSGKLLMTRNPMMEQPGEEIQLDLNGLAKGMYLLRVRSGDSAIQEKILLN